MQAGTDYRQGHRETHRPRFLSKRWDRMRPVPPKTRITAVTFPPSVTKTDPDVPLPLGENEQSMERLKRMAEDPGFIRAPESGSATG